MIVLYHLRNVQTVTYPQVILSNQPHLQEVEGECVRIFVLHVSIALNFNCINHAFYCCVGFVNQALSY